MFFFTSISAELKRTARCRRHTLYSDSCIVYPVTVNAHVHRLRSGLSEISWVKSRYLAKSGFQTHAHTRGLCGATYMDMDLDMDMERWAGRAGGSVEGGRRETER